MFTLNYYWKDIVRVQVRIGRDLSSKVDDVNEAQKTKSVDKT